MVGKAGSDAAVSEGKEETKECVKEGKYVMGNAKRIRKKDVKGRM